MASPRRCSERHTKSTTTGTVDTDEDAPLLQCRDATCDSTRFEVICHRSGPVEYHCIVCGTTRWGPQFDPVYACRRAATNDDKDAQKPRKDGDTSDDKVAKRPRKDGDQG